MIKNIENFNTKLQAQIFRQSSGLRDRKIHIPETWTVYAVATEIAKSARRILKGQWVKVSSGGIPIWQNKRLARHDVGTLAAVDAATVGDDIYGPAALHGKNRI